MACDFSKFICDSCAKLFEGLSSYHASCSNPLPSPRPNSNTQTLPSSLAANTAPSELFSLTDRSSPSLSDYSWESSLVRYDQILRKSSCAFDYFCLDRRPTCNCFDQICCPRHPLPPNFRSNKFPGPPHRLSLWSSVCSVEITDHSNESRSCAVFLLAVSHLRWSKMSNLLQYYADFNCFITL